MRGSMGLDEGCFLLIVVAWFGTVCLGCCGILGVIIWTIVGPHHPANITAAIAVNASNLWVNIFC